MKLRKKIKKLDLHDTLNDELKGLPSPNYVQKRIHGELQKKLNELVDTVNNLNVQQQKKEQLK